MNVLRSGGAVGADQIFDECARAVSHESLVMSFDGHKISQKVKGKVVIFSDDDLQEAEIPLLKANKSLKRKIPKDQYVKDLLRRNFFQIKTTERVYAVAPLNWDFSHLVKGGTGWAVQMAIDRGIPEIYVFDTGPPIGDQALCHWYKWHSFGGFRYIDVPPKPYGSYTGIGTRELTETGEKAIRQLYG